MNYRKFFDSIFIEIDEECWKRAVFPDEDKEVIELEELGVCAEG